MNEPQDIKPNIASLMASKSVLSPGGIKNVLDVKRPILGMDKSRLPSFKAPRDLTLSSSVSSALKPPVLRQKKKIMPNIPTKREKSTKVLPSMSEKASKNTQNKSKPFGKGRLKREKEFFQTKGSLFGDGVTMEPRKWNSHRGSGSSLGGSRFSKEESYMNKPVFDGTTAYHYDKELEEQKLKELLRDDFIDDPDDECGINNFPVRLPLLKSTELSQNTIIKVEPTVKVKEEPMDSADGALVIEQKLNDVKINFDNPVQQPTEESLIDILTEKNNDFIFMQLPSCFPEHPPESIYNNKEPPGKSVNAINETTKKKTNQCTMATLPEGRIGTIKIYKSGKAELWLGNHKLIISKGIRTGFLQDVIAMTTDSETRTGTMSVLGHIKHRLLCMPDFEALTQTDEYS